MANEIIDLQNEFVYKGQRYRLPGSGGGSVESVTINGQTKTPDSQGNVDLGTFATEDYVDDAIDEALNDVVVGTVEGVVIDNLLSDSSTDSLSARMGKQLAQDVDDIPVIDIHVDGRKLVINTNAALAPRVTVGALSNASLSARAGQAATATFKVSGRRLTAAITAALSDSTHFSISPASISPSSGVVEETTLTVTYTPGSGATAGTNHSCTITIASGGVTYGTLELSGTVAAAPSITLTPASLTISTESGQSGTGTINVKGAALDGDISLAISGNGFSLSTNTVSKADAESAGGKDITVTFDGSADGITGTITASSTGATSVEASVEGQITERLNTDEGFDIDNLHYTVLSDRRNVMVEAKRTNQSDLNSTSLVSGNVVIPSSVRYGAFDYNVTEMRRHAFSQSASLTGITIPDSITTYNGDETFSSCTSLTTVNLGQGATSIPSNMFIGCTALQSIVIPNQVTGLGGQLFRGCTSLTTIQLGTSTDYALTTLNGALKGASSNGKYSDTGSVLATLICYATTPPSFGGFDNTSGNMGLPAEFIAGGTLKVPSSAVSTYQTSSAEGKTLWSQIPTIQAITE